MKTFKQKFIQIKIVFFNLSLSTLITLALFALYPILTSFQKNNTIKKTYKINAFTIKKEHKTDFLTPYFNNFKIPAQQNKKNYTNITPLKDDFNFMKLNTQDIGFKSFIEKLPEHSFLFKIEDVDTPPTPIFQTSPNYPHQALKNKIEGKVEISFIVNEKGKTSDIKILKANPPSIFNKQTIDAIKIWTFNPASKDGKVVPVKVIMPIIFKMKAAEVK